MLYWLAAVFFFVYVHGDDKPGPVVNTRFGKVRIMLYLIIIGS